MIRRTLFRTLLATALTLGVGGTGVTATASAHDCPNGYVCLYQDAGFRGKFAQYSRSSFQWRPSQAVPRDRASSMINLTSLKACAGDRRWWGMATLWSLRSGANLQWVGAGANDRMDRISLVSSWAPCVYL